MKAIAWKDVPIGSFITTKRDACETPNRRYVWKKIDSDGYYNCESVADGNQSKVDDPEWECYLCDSEGNLIEEKKVMKRCVPFKNIKNGEFFKSNNEFYLYQKILPRNHVNAVLISDPPLAVIINDDENVKPCDKDGNIPEVWKPFGEIQYGEWFSNNNDVFVKVESGVISFSLGRFYCLRNYFSDSTIRYKIINRPDDVKLP